MAIEVNCKRWFLCVEINETIVVGAGWWSGSRKLFAWDRIYYDGNGISVRLGPLFFSRYPY